MCATYTEVLQLADGTADRLVNNVHNTLILVKTYVRFTIPASLKVI